MAMGKKWPRQQPMWIASEELPRTRGHVFYDRVNEILHNEKFNEFAEKECVRFYKSETMGRPSIAPGVYFRMLAKELADAEASVPEQIIREKWLYLALLWLFEKRDQVADPLAEAEDLVCDFGRPPSAVRLLRFMPMNLDGFEAPHQSAEQNRAWRMDLWRKYLQDAAKRFDLNGPISL